MASLHNINPDGANDGQQRSLDDFQFDLENVLTMVTAGWDVTRRAQCGLGDAGHLCQYQERDCSRGCGRDRHRRAKLSGFKVLCVVFEANTAGQAKVIVREDVTKNFAWAWARLRERFGRDAGATSFSEVFQCSWPSEKLFEDAWRE